MTSSRIFQISHPPTPPSSGVVIFQNFRNPPTPLSLVPTSDFLKGRSLKAHKYVRHEDVNVEELLKIEHDIRLEDIEKIITHNPMFKEYKACFSDGSVDYITILDDNHHSVQAYLKRVRFNIQTFKADEALWIKPIWDDT